MFGMPVRNCSTWFRVVASAGALLTWAANAVHAAPALPEGSKSITLISEAGGKLDLGHIEFKKDGDGATFEVTLANPEFHDEFLSMRPFQCLGGVKEMRCHLVYPYDLKRRITADDLADLEYSLLFLFKPPAGYGIDPWNGLYFKLALADDGTLSGPVHDVNLDPLGVPPADRGARTIMPADLTPADPATHRFAKVEVK